jgi:magnesium chelatase subunit I
MEKAKTIGELKKSGYKIVSVKEEIRNNVIKKLKNREELFPGIIGYDKTVIPALINAMLSRHDIILLGLRGQAKTKIVRLLPLFLDEWIPIIKDCEINDNPFKPICYTCTQKIKDNGDNVEIDWISREQRYGEKLATPDVTIADLIGDIDPIKAANQRLHYSHEGAIHFGIIPRTNRGIFAINELPDLQPRIQVGLLNIMQEKDIQIRGFNVRIPLDVLIVFTANPEDYTNRGNIITPLKDRISSQILTHYPKTVEDSIRITEQEAWTERSKDGFTISIPNYFKEIIEHISFQARTSEFVDQKSGVSARFTISSMENLISNAERRIILTGEKFITPRICDLYSVLPSMTGKMELVFEGEQEGAIKVGKALIGKAVKETFKKYFPDPYQRKLKTEQKSSTKGQIKIDYKDEPVDSYYQDILEWFESGNNVLVSDNMMADEYFKELDKVKGLKDLTKKHLKVSDIKAELASAMEFVLEGLHQNSRLAKEEAETGISYRDMLGSIFGKKGSYFD